MKNNVKNLLNNLCELIVIYILSVFFIFLVDRLIHNDNSHSLTFWLEFILWIEGMYVGMSDFIVLFETLRNHKWKIEYAKQNCNFSYIVITLPIFIILFIIFLPHNLKIYTIGLSIIVLITYYVIKLIHKIKV